MAEIFNIDFRTGSLIEKHSGAVGTNVNGKIVKGTKGLNYQAIQANSTDVTYTADDSAALNFGTDPFTIAIACRNRGYVAAGSVYNFIFCKGTIYNTNNGSIGLRNNSSNIPAWVWSNSSATIHSAIAAPASTLDGKYHLYVMTFDGTTFRKYFDEGSSTVATDTNTLDISSAQPLYIGTDNYVGAVRNSDSDIVFLKAYDTCLTQSERNELYKEFLQASPIEKPVRGFEYPKPTDLSKEVDSVLGDDLIGGIDLTDGWTPLDGNIVDANNFQQTTVTASVAKSFMTTGKKYKVRVTGSLSNSNTFRIKLGSSDYDKVVNGSFDIIIEGTTNSPTFTLQVISDNDTLMTIDSLIVTELSGLIAAYSFSPETVSNGTLLDISGNGNNGTINGALLTKDGMKFDGVDDYISVLNDINDPIDFNGKSFTILHRFKTTDTFWRLSNNRGTGSYGTQAGWQISVTSSTWENTAIDDGAGNTIEFDGISYNEDDNKLRTLALTFDTTTGTGCLYIDGTLRQSITNANLIGANLNSGRPLRIGVSSDTGTQQFNGEIQDFKIYHYAFTPQQAKDYHNSFIKPVLLEDFENYPVGSYPNPQGTGVYTIEEYNIEQGELVTNGGFDEWTGELADNWALIRGITTKENGYNTGYSQGLSNPAGNTGYLSQARSLTLNKRYRISLRYKAEGAGGYFSDVAAPTSFSNVALTSTSWTHISFEFNAKLATGYWGLYVNTNATAGVNKIYIDNISIVEIPPVPSIGQGKKLLNCGTAGTTAIQSKQAYGTWEFDVYKGASGNTWINYFLNTLPNRLGNGYRIAIDGLARMFFQKTTGAGASNLFVTATAYIANNTYYRLKVARLQSEGVFKDIPTLQEDGCINSLGYPYTSFTSNGRYGYSVISNGSGIHIGGTATEISITNTAKYLVEFDLKLNSGALPRGALLNAGSSFLSNFVQTVNGKNSHIFTATSTNTCNFSTYNNPAASSNYEISGLTIRRIYDASTFAVFIRGGIYGNTSTGWTLVDTTSGSGSNPVTDSNYTTSEYIVADLDAGDKIAAIKTFDGVKQ